MTNIKTCTREIDGYQIIVGFGYKTEDPEATKAAVKPLVSAHQNAPVIENKKREVGAKNRRLGELRKLSVILWTDPATHRRKAVLDVNEKKVDNALAAEWNQVEVDSVTIQDELTVLNSEVEASRRELTRANIVYFQPNANEYHFDDAKTSELMGKHMSKGVNEQVDIEGAIVPDFRGVKIWEYLDTGWNSTTISRINVVIVDGCIRDSDLTDEQRQEIDVEQESTRINLLTAEEKQTEIAGVIDAAAGIAATMKTKLEIQGATAAAALTQSKAFYQSEVDAINLKYGV